MGLISLPTSFVDGTIPTAAQFNSDFTTLANEFNGNIDNSNVKALAGILESKIAFNTSTGHSHNGVDSKLIAQVVSYGGYISGSPAVGNDLSLNPRVRSATTATRFSVHAKTAPTGADAIFRCWNITQGVAVASVTLTAGQTDATTTSMTTASIASGDKLRFDITQQGSTIAAANATCQIDGTV